MNVVIDVSGIAEILFKKEKCEKFHKAVSEASAVLAPDIYISELTNTLWKYKVKNIFTGNECIQFIRYGISFVDTFINSNEIWQEAFSEGIKNNHSIYDMFYFVCARRNNAVLVTSDSDLAEICKKHKIPVIYPSISGACPIR